MSKLADTVLVVTTHKKYPKAPPEGESGYIDARVHPVKAHRDLRGMEFPTILGPPPGPPGFGTLVLTCQNLGASTEPVARFRIDFEGAGALHQVVSVAGAVRTDDGSSDRVAEFLVEKLRAGKKASVELTVRNNAPFEARLWKGVDQSKEVFVYDITVGEPTPSQHAPKVTGRNDPCPCGSGKKFKKCHGAAGVQ